MVERTPEAPLPPPVDRRTVDSLPAAPLPRPRETITLAGGGESDRDEHGRIGYGRYGRYTPVALTALLVVSLLLIGLYQRGVDSGSGDGRHTGRLAGRSAPAVALTLLDGSTLRLADLRGSVVVVNFWASWCDPCQREAPAFQTVSQDAARTGGRVVVVGIDLKNDQETAARAFVRDRGLTYPIGRDTGGDDPTRGAVERAFGIDPLYPTTLFIRPDGRIAQAHVGELDLAAIRAGIAAARTGAAAR